MPSRLNDNSLTYAANQKTRHSRQHVIAAILKK